MAEVDVQRRIEGLSLLQRERNEWVARNFPDDELINSVLGAMEEIGEIVHHYLKWKQGIRGNPDFHREEMLDGVADTVIFLAGVCTHLKADYGALVYETWDRVKQRDWVANPQEGT